MLEIIASATTLLVMITFIVIVFWAWGRGREADFTEAANLVFDEPQDAPLDSSQSTSRGEK